MGPEVEEGDSRQRAAWVSVRSGVWCGELYSEGLAFVKFTTGARGMCVGAEIGCATDGKKVQMYRHHQTATLARPSGRAGTSGVYGQQASAQWRQTERAGNGVCERGEGPRKCAHLSLLTLFAIVYQSWLRKT